MNRATIRTAVRQTKPFAGPEQEVFVGIQRAASELGQGLTELLRPLGLTGAQYNVLRILRGAGANGLACREVADRLIAHDPDVTRLLDRMEKDGLVTRERDNADRRVVTARITAKGQELAAQLDEPVAELHRRQLGHLGAAKLSALADLLGAIVSAPREKEE